MATKKQDPPVKVDENEGIPRSVLAQATKADELQTAILGEGKTAPPVQNAPGEPAPPGQEPPAPPVTEPPPEAPPQTPTEGHWKTEYDALKAGSDTEILTLQGDVKRLNDAIWEQSQSLTSLLKQNEALIQAGTAPVNPAQAGTEGAPGQPAGITPVQLNPEDFTGYGQEIVDLVQVVNALKVENADLKGASKRIQNIEVQTTRTAQDRMWEHLDENVTDWENINKTAPFLGWLGEVDPLSGYKRQVLLDDAVRSCDGPRVAGFFSKYFAETGTQPPAGEPPPAPAGEIVPPPPPVLPDGTGAGEPPGGPPPGPTITKDQFLTAQKEMQTGRRTYEEYDKLATQYQKQEVARARAA